MLPLTLKRSGRAELTKKEKAMSLLSPIGVGPVVPSQQTGSTPPEDDQTTGGSTGGTTGTGGSGATTGETGGNTGSSSGTPTNQPSATEPVAATAPPPSNSQAAILAEQRVAIQTGDPQAARFATDEDSARGVALDAQADAATQALIDRVSSRPEPSVSFEPLAPQEAGEGEEAGSFGAAPTDGNGEDTSNAANLRAEAQEGYRDASETTSAGQPSRFYASA